MAYTACLHKFPYSFKKGERGRLRSHNAQGLLIISAVKLTALYVPIIVETLFITNVIQEMETLHQREH